MFFDARAVLFTFVVMSTSLIKGKTKNEAVLMCGSNINEAYKSMLNRVQNVHAQNCLELQSHMRTALFLVFTFIKEGLKTTKVKSTACSSKEIKTNHQRAFCATHRLLSYP